MLTGCGQRSAVEEGITADPKGTRIDVTCVDYVGNKVIEITGMRGSIEEDNGNMTITPKDKPKTEIKNGGGCIAVEWFVDPTLPANKAAFKAASDAAPLYVVITNSSDMILFAEKFSKVTSSSASTKTELGLETAGHNDLYKVTVTGGLSLISTPNKSSLSPALADAFPTLEKK